VLTFVKQNKFLVISLVLLIAMAIVDLSLAWRALQNTGNQILSMLLIVPPIFVLIGLFDVWVPRETIIEHLGDESGFKGMVLSFFLGAFSAGPTLVAFPVAYLMLRKGAKYNNVLFFLMTWSSLKLPIVFFQITTIGLRFSLIIDLTMLLVFYLSASIVHWFVSKEEVESFVAKANAMK
jgi:uncharacterized membrane protein YraQ (UPF0718 family)